MARMKRPPSAEEQERIRHELHRDVALRQRSYREQALKMFPHLCARCGRELEGKRLSELTVHHIDHNHANNPLDGSNWELLCLYCHDHEHEKYKMAGHLDTTGSGAASGPALANPFEKLDGLLKGSDSKTETKSTGDRKTSG